MKAPISSIGQAKEEMARLASFYKQSAALVEQATHLNASVVESIEALQSYLGILDGVLGSGLGAQSKPSKGGRPPAGRMPAVKLHASGYRATKESDAPSSVKERVLVIMRDIGKPVLPKEIALQYLLHKWPLPKKGTIYNLISGTVAYLYNRKGVLVKGETGYTLKPYKDFSELLNTPVLPPTAEERTRHNTWQKQRYALKQAEKKAAKAALEAQNPPLPFEETRASG